MQQLVPEMPPTVPPKPAQAAVIVAAITDINRDFLRLLVHPATRVNHELLGLQQPLLDSLRKLSNAELNCIAEVPVLLAEFNLRPEPAGIADASYLTSQYTADWLQELRSFADRLLTLIWQATRHDQLMAAFCVGCDTSKRSALADLSFTAIRRLSDQTAGALHARLAAHPCVWADLIRSARSGNSAQLTAAQLAWIQLSVAPRWSDGVSPCTIARHAGALTS